MALLKVVCPVCKSEYYVRSGSEYCFCTFCGAKTTLKNIVVSEDFSSAPVCDRRAEAHMLEKAFSIAERGYFSRAGIYFEEVLNENPECSQAYLGRLMCRLQCSSLWLLFLHYDGIKDSREFKLAVRYATAEDFERYNEILCSGRNREIERLSAQLEEIEEQITDLRYLLENSRNRYSVFQKKRNDGLLSAAGLLGFGLLMIPILKKMTVAVLAGGLIYAVTVEVLSSAFGGDYGNDSARSGIRKKLLFLMNEKESLSLKLNELENGIQSIGAVNTRK